ncbi:glycerophosphoryl diester phosphodiesterase [Actinorhabdospora filicis]|uniref:Glycerophosphoryl diester phosphodiesterase n=1 Tax=Actinorhabdospora filicis TaxID=1785913 RepID=A0A9W6ST33_9ACTN|nr:glycerophosphodiester phosphodiesterase family protein [Actinorhabdospora filicis]GLZ81332.1 glycerophosphoryl diester phosphodiesterase [Actinorhabdospora filicis]
MRRQPMIVAHRGSNAVLPEHSLAAYAEALELGVDALECDVRLTRDGHLVLHHDRLVNRTSDGQGAVSDLSLRELRAMDFAVNRDVPDGPEYSRIVTLPELLELIGDRPVKLLVETKHPTRYGARVERRLFATLKRYPHVDAEVMSFSRAALHRARVMSPATPLVWLFQYPLGPAPSFARTIGADVRMVLKRLEMIDRAHRAGRQVYVWTVNDPGEALILAKHGVDAIISDRPDVIRQALLPA